MRPDLYPVFWNRDFSTPIGFPGVKLWVINNYSWNAIGGPEKLSMTAYGSERVLWSLMEWLRAPVDIMDARGEKVWWGYISSVTVKNGALETKVDLEGMYNRIKVAYCEEGGSYKRQTTGWGQDDFSVATYGKRELLKTMASGNSTSSVILRDSKLTEKKYPIPGTRVQESRGAMSATIECKGWWSTLDWVYYEQSAGREAYLDNGSGLQNFGKAAESTVVGQSFKTSTNWSASYVEVSVRKNGSPTDSVQLLIRADTGGNPSTTLASCTVAAADIGKYVSTTKFVLNIGVALTANTTYWVTVQRTGANDDKNYYTVNCDEAAGYTKGVMRIWNGGTWVARNPNASMNFAVYGTQENTQQMSTIESVSGQFINGFLCDVVSGANTNQFRNGDTTALKELTTLLQQGTNQAGGTGARRYLATITKDRNLYVYPEPLYDPATVPFLIRKDGTIEGAFTNVLQHTCPVGVWCQLKDVIPSSLNSTTLADASFFFIERSEYNPRSGHLRPEPRGTDSDWNVAEYMEG